MSIKQPRRRESSMTNEEVKTPEPTPHTEDYLGDVGILGHYSQLLHDMQEFVDLLEEGEGTVQYWGDTHTSFGMTVKTGPGDQDVRKFGLKVGPSPFGLAKDTELAKAIHTQTAYIVERALYAAALSAERDLWQLVSKGIELHLGEGELQKFKEQQAERSKKKLEKFKEATEKIEELVNEDTESAE